MLVAMDSNTNSAEKFIIHVVLLSENVYVSRPVLAKKIAKKIFFICEQKVPDHEVWEFEPGTFVSVEERRGDDEAYLLAVAVAKGGRQSRSARPLK
ncbi:hypothetical protein ACFSQT_00720 [Mesorhizobium calcicola]|uniref:Uncharacterized protein n=1 Tax=Mesorhizobium calcicola TaxID=1300310 RepID=A0ABW4W800_9HYPH